MHSEDEKIFMLNFLECCAALVRQRYSAIGCCESLNGGAGRMRRRHNERKRLQKETNPPNDVPDNETITITAEEQYQKVSDS